MSQQPARSLWIDGLALWTPQAPDWAQAAPLLRGHALPERRAAGRPAPVLLAPNERRRASDTVAMAVQVASDAMSTSGHDIASTASVFTSAHGDLPITDAMCRTLADSPLLLSPTRFHQSVHNAASGYWAIASGSHAASTALSAYQASFAAGWLEAACQCVCEQQPVLLVAYDTEARGTLASVNGSRGMLGLALVLSPRAGPASRWHVSWQLDPAAPPAAPLRSALARTLADNAMADALPLMEALARGEPASLGLHDVARAGAALRLDLLPLPA